MGLRGVCQLDFILKRTKNRVGYEKAHIYVMSWDKTSHMLHNIKGQKFEFYLKMSKFVHFLFSSKTKYL